MLTSSDIFEDNFTFVFQNPTRRFSLFPARRLAGRVETDHLLLGKSKIYYKDIVKTSSYQKYLVITLAPYATVSAEISNNLLPDSTNLVLKLSGTLVNMEHKIDRKISAYRLEIARQHAQSKGLVFRKEQCPKCQCDIDLTQKTETQFTYCPYCDNIFDRNSFLIPKTEAYQVCPDCHYYGRVQTYYEWNFYFLIYKAKFSIQRHHFCDTCARRMFERTFFKNLTLVLGSIVMLFQYFRSLQGRNPYLYEIAQANRLAQDGKLRKADALYNTLLTRNFGHPGIHYNYGLAYLKAGDTGRAAIEFEKCLNLCSNYQPVIDLMTKYKDLEIELTKEGGFRQGMRGEN